MKLGDLVRVESNIIADGIEYTVNLWPESTYAGWSMGEWNDKKVGIFLGSREESFQHGRELVRWTSYLIIVDCVIGWVDSRDVGLIK